ncbi:hypothetical protein [Amaricoccus macauensis]|uniref:hypothetical protein n=1 Tax=Amaricoccus macauensis TaxID=57001 RepID=UPI003C7A0B87
MQYVNLSDRILDLRRAAGFAAWLREEGGPNLVETAALFGGPHWGSRADALIQLVTEGAEPLEHIQDLRALRDFLHDALGGGLPVASVEDGDIDFLEPDDPKVICALECLTTLDQGVTALDAARTLKRRLTHGALGA